jgi:DNA-binding beta-propeller fold protein YncE
MTKRNLCVGAAFLASIAALGFGSRALDKKAAVEAAVMQVPTFEVDPMWPKPLPNHWVIGQTIGVSVDAQDHVWIIHRQGSLEPKETYSSANPPMADCCTVAPPILAFDQDGNLVQHWGGPGAGYDWPMSNHGVTVDYKGNVWIGGNGNAYAGLGAKLQHDDMVLKFTMDGKFLMQIGHPDQSKGSNDTENLKGPAKMFVDPAANELYVADGYGNRRVIVFDADTGKYKRHWGAYGHVPDDADQPKYDPDAPVDQQFRNPVHCAQLANDGLLYVCDRANDRIQVFKKDGTFVKEQIIEKRTLGDGSVWDIAFSRDPEQKFIFLSDGANEKVHILLRDTLQTLTSFGDGGRQPGEFYAVHSIAIDSKGNLYTTETYRGQRVQKFVYKGMGPITKEDQGVLWPKSAK